MKAIQIVTAGSTEVLAVVDVPIPVPRSGEALVQIDSSGVNFIDIYYREGRYPAPLPLVLGQEGGGTIVDIGPGKTGFKRGDRVVWRGGFGTYAEFAVVPMERLLAIPEGITLEEAAASITQGLTAHYLTHSAYPIQPDDTVLIHAGAGGTGLLAIQMAKALGARVLTTVSTEQAPTRSSCIRKRISPIG
ncbi:MAG TPA: alcohol dehydrogenase catalytic domain-containing protein [Edaphobacter sp.]|nr:alcohol dehydrogenase catalytic domain-containing protein [Edaphobacter sp.]